MAVKTVLKYVLLVLAALLVLSFLMETMLSVMIMVDVTDGISAGIFLFSLAALAFHVLGLYGIFNEHFTSSVIFSVVLVLCFIATVLFPSSPVIFIFMPEILIFLIASLSVSHLKMFASLNVFHVKSFMFFKMAIFTAMMVSYTIMIRKKTPVEERIDNRRPQNEDVWRRTNTKAFSCDRLWWGS